MYKFNVLFSVLAITILSFTAYAQSDETSGAIRTKDGLLIVSNEAGNYYTFEIRGKEIKPLDNPSYFTVDGKFFQIVLVAKKTVLSELRKKADSDRDILEAHRVWESDYISKTLGAPLKVESEWKKLANGFEALLWNFDMPKVDSRQTAKKQLYITISKGDYVFGANGVVEGDETDEKVTWQLIIDAVSTLKMRDKPLNLAKAADAIRKGQDLTN